MAMKVLTVMEECAHFPRELNVTGLRADLLSRLQGRIDDYGRERTDSMLRRET
jgi:hypothetical protein